MEFDRLEGKLEDIVEMLDSFASLPEELRLFVELEPAAGKYKMAIKSRLGPKAYKRIFGDATFVDLLKRTYGGGRRWT